MWGFAGVLDVSAPLKCISRNPLVGVHCVIIIYALVSSTALIKHYTSGRLGVSGLGFALCALPAFTSECLGVLVMGFAFSNALPGFY